MVIDRMLSSQEALATQNGPGADAMRPCRGVPRRTADVPRVTIPLLAAVAISCACVGDPGPHAAVIETSSYDQQIGWLHGRCLAISNPKLAPGTAVAVVITGEPQRVEQAQIQRQTDSSETCSALLPGRAKLNAKPEISFYMLGLGSIANTDMGIGIVAPSANPTVVNGLARVDLDRDGGSEVFSSCTTSEGIKFGVWTDKAYQGKPRWSGYYYLGYDMTPSCP
jgi:hypothetical protein